MYFSISFAKIRISEEKTKRILTFLERKYLRPQVKDTKKLRVVSGESKVFLFLCHTFFESSLQMSVAVAMHSRKNKSELQAIFDDFALFLPLQCLRKV